MNRIWKWIGVLLLVTAVLSVVVIVITQAAWDARANQSHPDYIEKLAEHTAATEDNLGLTSDALPVQWT